MKQFQYTHTIVNSLAAHGDWAATIKLIVSHNFDVQEKKKQSPRKKRSVNLS